MNLRGKRTGPKGWDDPPSALPLLSNSHPPTTKKFKVPWKSKTKQRMVFGMIHVKDFPLLMGKVWSLDFLGVLKIKVLNLMFGYFGVGKLPYP